MQEEEEDREGLGRGRDESLEEFPSRTQSKLHSQYIGTYRSSYPRNGYNRFLRTYTTGPRRLNEVLK